MMYHILGILLGKDKKVYCVLRRKHRFLFIYHSEIHNTKLYYIMFNYFGRLFTDPEDRWFAAYRSLEPKYIYSNPYLTT